MSAAKALVEIDQTRYCATDLEVSPFARRLDRVSQARLCMFAHDAARGPAKLAQVLPELADEVALDTQFRDVRSIVEDRTMHENLRCQGRLFPKCRYFAHLSRCRMSPNVSDAD